MPGLDRALLLALAAIAGWVAGAASAYLTERLVAPDPELTLPAHRGLWLRDARVQVALALLWPALLLTWGPEPRFLASAALSVPLVQVAVTDIRYQYVFLPVAVAGLLLGVALSGYLHGAHWIVGPVGAVGGTVLFGALFLVGRALYRGVEAIARGDVWIAAMVGAIAGTYAVSALIGGILVGGLFAFATLLARRDLKAMMPYGPGLCVAGLVTLFRA